MVSGYVKLYRSIEGWEWSRDPITYCLFTRMLASANFKPNRFMGHDIPIGSLVFTYPSYAERIGCSVKNIRTALSHLKATGEVAVKKTSKFSIISITNWEQYQQDGSQTGSQVAVNRQSTGSQVAALEEGKNLKREEGNSREHGSDEPELEIPKPQIPEKPKPTATSMQEDWELPEDWKQWAFDQGLDPPEIREQAETFRDHFLGKNGPDARKKNWKATWRNWVRRYKSQFRKTNGNGNGTRQPKSSQSSRIDAIDEAFRRRYGTPANGKGGEGPPLDNGFSGSTIEH